MQNKKVTMLAAVLAVTVIAMAGVGYALTYTATTHNTNNGMDTTYLKLTQDASEGYTTNFLTNLYFDTDNNKVGNEVKTTFSPVGNYLYDNQAKTYTKNETNAANASLISKALVLTVEAKNTGEPSVNMTVTADPFDSDGTGLKYTMILVDGYDAEHPEQPIEVYKTADYDGAKWFFEGIAVDDETAKDYTVLLFVTKDGTPNGQTGFPAATGTGSLTCEFEFKISATA